MRHARSRTTGRRDRGYLVAIVGPDGVGKTTLARGLLSVWDGPSRYVHFRPPLLGPLAEGPTESALMPKVDEKGSIILGWLRLLVNLSRFWAGYLLRIRPILREDGLVVADRWAYGYVAQPRALRFYGPAWLARSLLRVFPRPSLAVIAKAPLDVILARKQELNRTQICEELAAWDTIASLGPTLHVDTTEPPEKIAMHLKQFLLSRQP